MDYRMLEKQMQALMEESTDPVAVMANASALLYEALHDVNWAGFYVVKNGELLLGPFQGKVACVRIARGRGVCGTAWEEDAEKVVPNVHAFPGHIACDSASRSEIVIPMHRGGKVCAVLDIDSPLENRFSAEDAEGLRAFAALLEARIGWRD